MNKRQRKKHPVLIINGRPIKIQKCKLKRASLKALRVMSRYTYIEEPMEEPIDLGMSAFMELVDPGLAEDIAKAFGEDLK